jgi:hypothetical protein
VADVSGATEVDSFTPDIGLVFHAVDPEALRLLEEFGEPAPL